MLSIEALATDYDGTLARDGQVAEATKAALRRFKHSGRRLWLVTGRQLPHLQQVFPDYALFDAVVAENGAVIYWPARDEERRLGPPPPPEFVAALRRRGVEPEVGRGIVATSRANQPALAAALAEVGLAWRPIFNKDSVMCLPPGVDKATGLRAVLDDPPFPPALVMGVGDAENDVAFLRICGVAAVVENALPALKAGADVVARGDDGDGVVWLIERVLEGTLERFLRPAPAATSI